MTTTDQTTVTTTEAPAGVRFRFTVRASELGAAMRNVSAFAGTDDTLPVLTGVHVIASEDVDSRPVPGSADRQATREITLLATDRYTLARQILTVDANDVAGAGEVTLPKELVKTLAGAWRARDYELASITVGDDDTVTVRNLDGAGQTVRALDGQFPRCGKMLDDFRPATDMSEVSSLPSVAFNAKYIARFAKVGKGQETVTFTFAADSVHNYSGSDKRSARPVQFKVGDVTGLICAIRLASD